MKPMSLFALLAPLLLAGCGESPADEPAALVPIDNAQLAGEQAGAEQQLTPVDIPDETVVEAEPEVGGDEPMDMAAPMDSAAPMNEDFGSEDAPVE